MRLSPPLIGLIQQDKHVKEAIRAQTPLLIRSPISEPAQNMEAIAASVANLLQNMQLNHREEKLAKEQA